MYQGYINWGESSYLIDRVTDIDPSTLQDPRTVAETIRFVLRQPPETVIPRKETSWP